MTALARFVMKYKKVMVGFWLVLMLAGVVLFFCTPINYNMMDYLPTEANSTKALDKMEEEFDEPLPNLNVMVENVSITEALELKEKIRQGEEVKEVIWLDDTIDLKQPLEIQDKDAVETYYKDGNALFMVSVTSGKERSAIASVKEKLGRECVLSGNASDQADSQNLALTETIRSILMLAPVIIIILILETESWLEPVCYLLTLGVSVLINLGTNIFMGEVSFVTLAAAPLLQVAVSLDYAVFLAHSFHEHKESGFSSGDAMRMAMQASSVSVTASMLTTLFGFFALLFMQFKIGANMGISLVKGVLISYICVLTFFPAILLVMEKKIEHTRHRPFMPSFSGIGKGLMKVRIPAIILIAIVMVPAFWGQKNNSFFYGNYEKTPTDSGTYQVEKIFGTNNSMVLMVPAGDSVKESSLCEELKSLKHITSVTAYVTMVSNKIPDAYLDQSVSEQFYSDDYARIILSCNSATEGEEAFSLVEEVRGLAGKYYGKNYYTCGQTANMYDMMDFVQSDNRVVNTITLISIYLILLVMTKNWLTPLLLILTIKCSIWLNMSVPYFTGNGLSYLGYLIVSTVQMGATVDYAILLTNTYQINRLRAEAKTAMKQTLGDVFSSVLISALILTLSGFCLAFASSNSVVKILGTLIGRGAVLAVVMVMLLLPSLLLMTDKILPHTGLLFWKRKENRNEK